MALRSNQVLALSNTGQSDVHECTVAFKGNGSCLIVDIGPVLGKRAFLKMEAGSESH
jgi:hypothetical protein